MENSCHWHFLLWIGFRTNLSGLEGIEETEEAPLIGVDNISASDSSRVDISSSITSSPWSPKFVIVLQIICINDWRSNLVKHSAKFYFLISNSFQYVLTQINTYSSSICSLIKLNWSSYRNIFFWLQPPHLNAFSQCSSTHIS